MSGCSVFITMLLRLLECSAELNPHSTTTTSAASSGYGHLILTRCCKLSWANLISYQGVYLHDAMGAHRGWKCLRLRPCSTDITEHGRAEQGGALTSRSPCANLLKGTARAP